MAGTVKGKRGAGEDPAVVDPYINRWWKAKDDDQAARALWLWIDRLRQRWAYDNLIDLVHEAIYEGRPLATAIEYPAIQHLRRQKSSPANLNITRSMVDTATARLCKRRPFPVIGADDAGYSEKRFAKRASRVLRRKLAKPNLERMKPDVIRDSLIRGTGVTKTIRVGGDVTIERVPRFELVIDPREARYGEPRTLAQVKPVPREVLATQFPDYLTEINAAAAYERIDQWTLYAYDGPSYFDHVEVAEAWHLPSSPTADDGQHVISIRKCVLLREPWKRARFPFPRMHWSAPVRGWWGHGLVEDLTGIQAKINNIARDAQEGFYWGSALKIFQARMSNVNKRHLRARHPAVVEYDGAPPQYVAPNPVSSQSLEFLEWLIKEAYEISGISQMTASSKNPLGSNASGKALDTMYDIESDRFAQVEIAQAMWMCDIGTLLIDEARALDEEAKSGDSDLKPSDLAPWIREIEWKKIDIDSGDFHLGVEPINFLPDSRAGKLSWVKEATSAGLIPDPSMTADLFDEPDIARMNRTTLGPKHNLDRIMEGIADPEVDMLELAPDEYMNLPLGVLMAKGELNEVQAEMGNNPSEEDLAIQDRFRQWIDLAKQAMQAGQPANASPSLPGMPVGPNMPAMPTAGSLQPGLGAGGPPMPAPPGAPPGMPAPGMMPQ